MAKKTPVRTRPPDYHSDDRRRAALVLFQHGIGYAQASWILGMSVNTLHEWSRAWRAGKFAPEVSPKTFRYEEGLRERVIELRKSGMTWKAVSEATGASVSSCRKWVKDAGQDEPQAADVEKSNSAGYVKRH